MKTIIMVAALMLSGLLVGGANAQGPIEQEGALTNTLAPAPAVELRLTRGRSAVFDLRNLPQTSPLRRERPEREAPEIDRVALPGAQPAPTPLAPLAMAPAPAPLANFAGLDFSTWGAGHPPDTNGDVGPVYYIQSINSSIGIYRKSDGVQIAAFTLDTFMSQGNFGNLCDTDNFGDPVILYDTFEDRWVITDFAFQVDGGGNVVNPPGAFECIAVSKSGDPVSGGWNFYSINTAGGLGDYPKFGIWPDGIYMSANMFGYASGAGFLGPRVYAFNKAQMYAGAPSVQVVTFDAPGDDFTLLPSNARLQTGTQPAGTPNYFISTWQYLNAVTVYKFHVDWNHISASTFTGPDVPLASTSWPNANPANAPSQGGNALDVLAIRAMMQNQYSNIGGVESLWTAHTVARANTTGFAAPRWYQVGVTGGVVAANIAQAATWDPDGANVMHRFMPSVAVNRVGDLALGYSTSSSTTKPAIKYAGRLASDPVNTFSQTEQVLIQGAGTQTGSCGGTCARWGDYSAMTLDPDGCTFWYTNEYYAANGLNYQTRIGSFAYPTCSAAGTGTLQGTVTASVGGAPIDGVTIMLGSRTTTTNASGAYAFAGLPSGTYPAISASKAGHVTAAAANIVVNDGATTIQDFALSAAPASACLVDTTLSDFQAGVFANLDLTTTPGNVTLDNSAALDQQNTSLGTSGVGITTTTWAGQTFTPTLSGQLVRAEINLFCSGCTGTTPNLTLSLRATSAGLPSGADLASATINGFNSGASGYFTATFAVPPVLVAGTTYALVIRPTANPSPGTYALTRSGTSTAGANTYAGGTRVTGATSGTVWSIPLTGGVSTDAGFKTYMNTGYAANGNLVSSNKDSNLAVGQTPLWSTLGWTATTPASTGLQFQVAASNASTGPFNFVGPDGTAGTFYSSSGGSLAQFNGKRYIKYRADLSTGNNAVTPTLNDVTVCYSTLAADVAITKTDGVATAVPGASVTYTITASNGSAAAATGVTVADTFPAALTCTWTCAGAGGGTCTASGSGNINDVINLPSGASSVYTATCAISAAASGTLANTATITSSGDPNTANNSATDTDTLNASADLSISKTDGVTTATPGGSVTDTITASNAGPSNVSGATVADTFPAALTCTWTCAGAGGGTCTASGSGNINGSVNLPSGGSVTYTASCAIAASASGTLSNTAVVAAPGGVTDPTPANNSATDSDTLNASADVAVTISDSRNFIQVGDSLDYLIEVSNPSGPSNAVASVSDILPVLLAGGSWTCTGSGGATCGSANGTGNTLSDTATLPVGGKTAYLYSATVQAVDPSELLANTASAVVGNASDPVPGNNSATDTNVVVLFRDGFDPGNAGIVQLVGSGSDYVAARLRVDANLLDALGMVPVDVATGQGADGRALFLLQLARFGDDYFLRVITRDDLDQAERSRWQRLDLTERLLDFAWQSASAQASDGYFGIDGLDAGLLVSGHSDQGRLTQLFVRVDNNTPWLVLVVP